MIRGKIRPKYLRKASAGFTLLEVLVASVILFSSIAAVSMVYRGAFLSSEKAENQIYVAGKVPLILASIRDEIRTAKDKTAQTLGGSSTMWQLNYQWNAEVLSFEAPQPVFSPESGKLEYSPPRFKLWQVELTVKYKSIEKSYQFKELSWING